MKVKGLPRMLAEVERPIVRLLLLFIAVAWAAEESGTASVANPRKGCDKQASKQRMLVEFFHYNDGRMPSTYCFKIRPNANACEAKDSLCCHDMFVDTIPSKFEMFFDNSNCQGTKVNHVTLNNVPHKDFYIDSNKNLFQVKNIEKTVPDKTQVIYTCISLTGTCKKIKDFCGASMDKCRVSLLYGRSRCCPTFMLKTLDPPPRPDDAACVHNPEKPSNALCMVNSPYSIEYLVAQKYELYGPLGPTKAPFSFTQLAAGDLGTMEFSSKMATTRLDGTAQLKFKSPFVYSPAAVLSIALGKGLIFSDRPMGTGSVYVTLPPKVRAIAMTVFCHSHVTFNADAVLETGRNVTIHSIVSPQPPHSIKVEGEMGQFVAFDVREKGYIAQLIVTYPVEANLKFGDLYIGV